MLPPSWLNRPSSRVPSFRCPSSRVPSFRCPSRPPRMFQTRKPLPSPQWTHRAPRVIAIHFIMQEEHPSRLLTLLLVHLTLLLKVALTPRAPIISPMLLMVALLIVGPPMTLMLPMVTLLIVGSLMPLMLPVVVLLIVVPWMMVMPLRRRLLRILRL